MDFKEGKIEMVYAKIEDLVSNQQEIIKLKVYSKSADMATFLVMKIIMFVVVGLFVLFLNIGLSIWLGEILGETYYGFFALAGFYAIAALIIKTFLYRNIEYKINNFFLIKILKGEKI
ncbi:hypothetical protein [Lacihabitans sp. CS3-21]|uniref:hypothetical protein n=1 Tax=Lacihabitans sp. CS3-21 TaxID=2487332 RepID=UPI0020CE3DD6|nr:hypothetical protein [Lacihabitans sp. CS3-21]MCP9746803.1 hypothetical protein [Lacihabitans sp. CS3-21]